MNTITLNLPDNALAALRAHARAQGRSAEDVAAEQLVALFGTLEDDLDAALEEAFAEMEAGKSEPFEPFAQELQARYFGPRAA